MWTVLALQLETTSLFNSSIVFLVVFLFYCYVPALGGQLVPVVGLCYSHRTMRANSLRVLLVLRRRQEEFHGNREPPNSAPD